MFVVKHAFFDGVWQIICYNKSQRKYYKVMSGWLSQFLLCNIAEYCRKHAIHIDSWYFPQKVAKILHFRAPERIFEARTLSWTGTYTFIDQKAITSCFKIIIVNMLLQEVAKTQSVIFHYTKIQHCVCNVVAWTITMFLFALRQHLQMFQTWQFFNRFFRFQTLFTHFLPYHWN